MVDHLKASNIPRKSVQSIQIYHNTKETVWYFVELFPLFGTWRDVVESCSNIETFWMEFTLLVKGKISPHLNCFRRTVQIGYL